VPALALSSLDGRPWRLADQRGRALVLNFWATWCGPCRDELPSLDRLARRLAQAPNGPRVLGVNYKESPDTIRRFLAGLPGVELPMLLDAQGTAMAAWTPRILPTTVLIDRSGRPLGSVVGEIDWDSAEAQALIAPLR
jgi:thiol-disulfide isomerase/thioredoxin